MQNICKDYFIFIKIFVSTVLLKHNDWFYHDHNNHNQLLCFFFCVNGINMTNLKNKSRKLKRSLKIKRRLRGGDCNGVVRNDDPTFWPKHNGCVNDNRVKITRLQKGTIIDRFGSVSGMTFSPVLEGVPYTYLSRGLPNMKRNDFRTGSNCNNEYNHYAQRNYHQYEVQKPFLVTECVVSEVKYNNDPEQSYPGGAIQYTLRYDSITPAEKQTIPGFENYNVPNVDDLIRFMYLDKVVPDRIPKFRYEIEDLHNANPGPIAIPNPPNPNPNANPNVNPPNPNANPPNPPNPNPNPNPPNVNPNADPNVFDRRRWISPLKSGVTSTPLISNIGPLSKFRINANNDANNDANNNIIEELAGGKRRRSVKRKRNNKRFT